MGRCEKCGCFVVVWADLEKIAAGKEADLEKIEAENKARLEKN